LSSPNFAPNKGCCWASQEHHENYSNESNSLQSRVGALLNMRNTGIPRASTGSLQLVFWLGCVRANTVNLAHQGFGVGADKDNHVPANRVPSRDVAGLLNSERYLEPDSQISKPVHRSPVTDLVLGHLGIYSNLLKLQHTIMCYTRRCYL
jgi:hypothetical protein